MTGPRFSWLYWTCAFYPWWGLSSTWFHYRLELFFDISYVLLFKLQLTAIYRLSTSRIKIKTAAVTFYW